MDSFAQGPSNAIGTQPPPTFVPPAPRVDRRARGGNRKRGAGGGKSAAGKAKKTNEGSAAADTVRIGRGAGAGAGGRGKGRGSRGGGAGRSRGRGRGGASRGAVAAGSLVKAGRGSKARESHTARRSPSELRASTIQRDRSPTAGGAAPDDGMLEVGEATTKARRDYDEDDDEGPEDDEEDVEGGLLENLGEEDMKWREEMEKIRGQAMGPLIMAMSKEQYDRHESYRRSGFTRSALRRLINLHLSGGYSNSSANPTITMAFGGVAKVFVGEIVEGARRIRREREGYEGDEVPLSPDEIMESYRVYSQSHGESGALARGRGNVESVMGQMGVGDGTGRRRRLF